MRRGRRGRPHLLCPPCPPIGRSGGPGAETSGPGAERGCPSGAGAARAARGRCAGWRASSGSQPRARRCHGRSAPTLRAVSGTGELCHRSARSARSQDRSRQALSGRGSCHSAKPVSSLRLRGVSAVQPYRICIPRICFDQGHRKPQQRRRHCVAHLLGGVRPVRSARVLQRSTPVLVPFLLRGQVRLPVVLHEPGALERRPAALPPARAPALPKAPRGPGQRREQPQRKSLGRRGRPGPGRPAGPEPAAPGQVKKQASARGDLPASHQGSALGPPLSTEANKRSSSSGAPLSSEASHQGSASSPQLSSKASKKGSASGPQLDSEASQQGSSSDPELTTDSTESSQDKAPETSLPPSSGNSQPRSPDTHSSGSRGYVASGSASGSQLPHKAQGQPRAQPWGQPRGQPRGQARGQARSRGSSSSQRQLHKPHSIVSTRPPGAQQDPRPRPQPRPRPRPQRLSQQDHRPRPQPQSQRPSQQSPQPRSQPGPHQDPGAPSGQAPPLVQSPSGTTIPAQPPSKAPSKPGGAAARSGGQRSRKWSSTSVPELSAPCCSGSSLDFSSESATQITCTWPRHGHGLCCLRHCWPLGYPAC